MVALASPIERGGKYVFEFGPIYFEVDPNFGARITSLKYAGTELLTGPEVEPVNYGSTFWPSPQSVWFWPPPAEIDSAPYAASRDGSTVTMVGSVNAALGLSVTKRFTPDLGRQGVIVEYSTKNHSQAPVPFAPWEITRVFPRGVTFYPTGSAPYPNIDLPLPVTTEAGGITWLEYDPDKVTAHEKLLADGAGGYIAHATDGVLLIKAFQDTELSQAAPGEGEIEIYLDGKKRYIEVEQQGAYASLAPGQTLSWTVRWYLRAIPAEVPLKAGSAGLVTLANTAAALC
jgi:hypothetical protein